MGGMYTMVMRPVVTEIARKSFVYTDRPSEHSPADTLALKLPPVDGEVTFTVMFQFTLTFRLGQAVWLSLTAVRRRDQRHQLSTFN